MVKKSVPHPSLREEWGNTRPMACSGGLWLSGLLIYERHWTIEVLFKELRGDLGLGDYSAADGLSRDAIQRHLDLCGLAHSAAGGLTHHSMEAVGAQARKTNTEVPLPTMSERLAALRDALRRDQVRRLFRAKRHQRLRQTVERFLLAA